VRPTHSPQVGHPIIAWKLEQDLLYALLQCFRDGEQRTQSPTHRFQVAILDRLEVALAGSPNQCIPLTDLCSVIGVSDRRLRTCCHAGPEMSPTAYMRLCRLTRVRAAIVNAEPGALCIAELARQFGFTDAGLFSAA
jgi:AraC-like DNA-binding protein